MEKTLPEKNNKWEKVTIALLAAAGVALFVLVLLSVFGGNSPQVHHVTKSDLINTKDISTLSVSEFIYNGIARTYKENGDHDYNVLYRSTVKVGIDADSIDYVVDEENKVVRFIFPEFSIQRPVIDEGSISIIPDRNDLHPNELITLCRNNALEEAQKSEKLISSARENLKSIIEAWYAPVFDGYTFDYQFGSAEGGEAK